MLLFFYNKYSFNEVIVGFKGCKFIRVLVKSEIAVIQESENWRVVEASSGETKHHTAR